MQQIVAMGGGGFSMEPDNLLLDRFIFSLVPHSHPKVLLLPTASGDSADMIDLFHDCIGRQLQARTAVLRLTKERYDNLEDIMLSADIIYVTGGHTTYMLDAWKLYGVDRLLRQAWERGTMLAGVSSGSACWFQEALTDSNPEGLSPEPCLSLLEGSHCAHYENTGRRPAFHSAIDKGKIMPGYGVENFVGMYFKGTVLQGAYASREGYNAYKVGPGGHGIEESTIPCTYLGDLLHKNS
ncbi:Type 1 glutamine amidotransferase-like domain-containing protein [Roseivirga sp. BDSF3-8]|uniref:Type 1 glutamine amidotransferase-like domain-containing protein n=1 Tax=Roseivirga sp. BDSF3-8 TaxID=3241598 RepID=UPI003531C84E